MVLEPREQESKWYCVRSKTKSEHVAARNLQQFAHLDEVFCPRIRYEKATRRGKIWFVEALFPGYLFARFNLSTELRTVNATPAVTGVLKFADNYPIISSEFLEELRKEFPEETASIRIIRHEIAPGDEIVVTEGALVGLETIVTRLVSGGDRVAVLLDWLGQEREAMISLRSVARPGDIRQQIQGR